MLKALCLILFRVIDFRRDFYFRLIANVLRQQNLPILTSIEYRKKYPLQCLSHNLFTSSAYFGGWLGQVLNWLENIRATPTDTQVSSTSEAEARSIICVG